MNLEREPTRWGGGLDLLGTKKGDIEDEHVGLWKRKMWTGNKVPKGEWNLEGGYIRCQWYGIQIALCTGGRVGTSSCCSQILADTWTHVSPHLCCHQLPEPRSVTAATTGTSCELFGEETNLILGALLTNIFHCQDWLFWWSCPFLFSFPKDWSNALGQEA